MTRWLSALSCLVLALGCSDDANSLSGSESAEYDLSFDSVVIVLQGQVVSVKYESSSGDPAILVVNTADLANVANVTIDLTQLDSQQPRGTLENVGGSGTGATDELQIERGTVVFDQVPKIGAKLSGQFNATMTDGYTLDGTFSGTVNAP